MQNEIDFLRWIIIGDCGDIQAGQTYSLQTYMRLTVIQATPIGFCIGCEKIPY